MEKKQQFLKSCEGDPTILEKYGYSVIAGRVTKVPVEKNEDKIEDKIEDRIEDKIKTNRLNRSRTTSFPTSGIENCIPRLSVMEEYKMEMTGVKLRSRYPTPKRRSWSPQTSQRQNNDS